MPDASPPENMSPELLKVAERAQREPGAKFHSLAYLIDVELLARAYRRIRKGAAVGVDGITKEQYGKELEKNLLDLYERMKAKRYRHQAIRRVHIPKGKGKTRPIGISALEDKVVQGAVREVLEAIYEQDFLPCSNGFRPGRSAHDALRALNQLVHCGKANWILEADIQSFFDSVNRRQLMEMLQIRVADGSMHRLVGKCLHVGVLEGEEFSEPEIGTAQGSILSPLLGNIYLHYVLDVWFEHEAVPRLKGRATLVRYADDLVIAFEYREDAERVMAVLGRRMEKFGLSLNPTKTRLVPFGRPPRSYGRTKGAATIDFLGFTLYWRRARWGGWRVTCKTRSARLTRAIQSVYDWCRSHRHLSIKAQHSALASRLRGHFNYFGVNGNIRSLVVLWRKTQMAWLKWLNRCSQRKRFNWERFADLQRDSPLPRPRITVQLWAVREA